jgi:hypothetical protein
VRQRLRARMGRFVQRPLQARVADVDGEQGHARAPAQAAPARAPAARHLGGQRLLRATPARSWSQSWPAWRRATAVLAGLAGRSTPWATAPLACALPDHQLGQRALPGRPLRRPAPAAADSQRTADRPRLAALWPPAAPPNWRCAAASAAPTSIRSGPRLPALPRAWASSPPWASRCLELVAHVLQPARALVDDLLERLDLDLELHQRALGRRALRLLRLLQRGARRRPGPRRPHRCFVLRCEAGGAAPCPCRWRAPASPGLQPGEIELRQGLAQLFQRARTSGGARRLAFSCLRRSPAAHVAAAGVGGQLVQPRRGDWRRLGGDSCASLAGVIRDAVLVVGCRSWRCQW